MELALSRATSARPRRRRLVLVVAAVNLGALVAAALLATDLGAPVPPRTPPPAVLAVPSALPPAPTPPAPPAPPSAIDDAMTRVLRDFTSADFGRVMRAQRVLAADPDRAVPALIPLLDRTDDAALHDTADLMYPCAIKFYGHGWMVWYELDRIADRAGWMLEELTSRDFGFRATGECGQTPRAHTAAAATRARAWLASLPTGFHFRDAFLADLAGRDRDRAADALNRLRNSYGDPLPLLTCDDYIKRVAPVLSAIARRRGPAAADAREILDEPPWTARCLAPQP